MAGGVICQPSNEFMNATTAKTYTEQMHACYQYRRGLAKNDVKQCYMDTTSWNENFSDGRIVEQDYDFNKDLLDESAPDTHPDIEGDDDFL